MAKKHKKVLSINIEPYKDLSILECLENETKFAFFLE